MQSEIKNYLQLKKYVRERIFMLEDYSLGEENILIEESLKTPKEKLFLKDFSRDEVLKIDKIIKTRLEGKPLNKIFKKCFFFENTFYIDDHVLAPRKETELLVEEALKFVGNLKKNKIKILDLCCGSGAIGLSVANRNKSCFVVLSDVSKKALAVCKQNQRALDLTKNTKIVESDLFKGLNAEDKFDIILSNPPYIKTNEIANLSFGVKNFDPIIALDGGEDGLNFYRKICKDCKNFLQNSGCIIVEIGFNQKTDVKKMFEDNGFLTLCIKDYSNNDRIVVAKLKNN